MEALIIAATAALFAALVALTGVYLGADIKEKAEKKVEKYELDKRLKGLLKDRFVDEEKEDE